MTTVNTAQGTTATTATTGTKPTYQPFDMNAFSAYNQFIGSLWGLDCGLPNGIAAATDVLNSGNQYVVLDDKGMPSIQQGPFENAMWTGNHYNQVHNVTFDGWFDSSATGLTAEDLLKPDKFDELWIVEGEEEEAEENEDAQNANTSGGGNNSSVSGGHRR